MKNNFFGSIVNNLKIVKELESYYFAVGLSPSANGKFVPVKFLNLDGSIAEQSISINEALYFIEYGTINIPAQSILTLAINYISKQLDSFLEAFLSDLFLNDFSKESIETRLNLFETQINRDLAAVLKENKKIYSYISNLIKTPDVESVSYFPDLSDYIKCMIYKK